MKRIWMTMVFAAAVMSTAAMSQEMIASVPFDFTAGGKTMASGPYSVARLSLGGGTYALRVRNQQTADGVLLVSRVAMNNGATGAIGKLVFRCSSGACALAQVHTPGESQGHGFATPAAKGGEKERLVAIDLHSGAPPKGF